MFEGAAIGGESISPPEPARTKRYTRETRQRIIREFAARHDGAFDAKLFEEEVRTAGESHEAYDWFTWDDAQAALEHRIYQAREFAVGLKVVFRIEELARNKTLRVVERDMPFVISPMAGRGLGGGYYLTNPDDPEHMREHCRQAATALRTWQARYSAAAAHVKKESALNALLAALDAAGE